MAYFIDENKRLLFEVTQALANHFGKKAKVYYNNSAVHVEVKEGYDKVVDSLTPEEIGGGVQLSLNGKNFVLKIVP